MGADTGDWIIRPAKPSEAESLARFGAGCFREAYGADTHPDDLEAHIAEHYGAAQQSREIADPDSVFLVAESASSIVAYLLLRQGEPPACVSSRRRMEVLRLYLAFSTHGRGLAQRLLAAATEAAAARGAEGLWLTVWERNPRAIAFYRKCGFVDVGETVFQVGNDPQRDRVMERPPGPLAG
ncbi:MAG: N-acetyltransferase family protein [Gammaproteobacteria bacterium]